MSETIFEKNLNTIRNDLQRLVNVTISLGMLADRTGDEDLEGANKHLMESIVRVTLVLQKWEKEEK